MDYSKDENKKLIALANYIDGIADETNNSDKRAKMKETSAWLRKASNYFCVAGMPCNGGDKCTSDHK